MSSRRESLTGLVPPLVGGLLIVVVFIGLIGTAIRSPQPHDIPVGLVGPAPAVQQMSTAFGANAPGAFQFTTYASEQDARAALDARTVDGVLVLSTGNLIVAGAGGDGATGVITAAFTNAFKAQGNALTVEIVHPFPTGDAHGLILFFVVLATLISTLASQAILFGTGKSVGLGLRLGFIAAYGVLVGLTAMGMGAWIAGGYGDGFWAAAGLDALASMALGAMVGALARPPGSAGHRAGGPGHAAQPRLVGRADRQPVPARPLPGARALDDRCPGVQRLAGGPVFRRRGAGGTHHGAGGMAGRRPGDPVAG